VVVGASARTLSAAAAAAVFCAALVLPCCLSAQDQAAAQKTPRRILVSVEKTLFSGLSADDLGVLQRSFLTSLSIADGAPSPVAYGQKAFPSRPADRDKAARAVGADAWLLLVVSGSKARPVLRVESSDLIYETHTLGFTVNRREPFPLMDINREEWGDVIPLVVKAYPAMDPEVYSGGPPAAATLIVRALPGTVISGLSPKPVTVGKDGAASVDPPSPAPYTLRATLAGYVPSTVSFYLDGQKEIAVTQVRVPWLLFDLVFLDGLYPGVSATLASSPFPGFLRLGFTTFRFGIAVNQDQFFSSLPLSQFTLLAGIYLSPEDKPTRWYVGAGPVLRVSIPPGGSFTVDELLPWGVQLVGGVEFSLVPHLRLFVEHAPSGYFTPQPALFNAYYGNDVTIPYFLLGSAVALDPFEVRIGLRWVL